MRGITKRFPSQDRIIVGADTESDDGFWKGVAFGAGGLFALGIGLTLLGQSMQAENARQNRELENSGREVRERAARR